VLLLINKQDFY